MPPAISRCPPGRLMPTTTSHAIQAAIAESEDRFSDAAGEYQIALSNLPKGWLKGRICD